MAYQESNSIEFSEPLKRPIRLGGNRAEICKSLDRLGFEVPATITAMAASSTAKLGSTGLSVDLNELDAAMKKFDLKTSDKIRFKIELEREGLLK
jgi:hypothetical protein